MKKMINRTLVEGFLVEKNLRNGVTKAGVPYIGGKLHIDTGNNNVIVVDVFEQQKTSKGLANAKYDVLSGIFVNGKCIHDGSDDPTSLRVSSAFELNDWMSDGEQRTSLINSGGYITVVNNPNKRAEFEVDIVVKSVTPEIRNEEETGRALVSGLIFNYRNQALPIRFVVENKEGVEFFSNMDPDTFTKVWGVQVINTIGSQKTEESAFGVAKVVQSAYTRKENIITGAQTMPYEREELTKEELNAAVQARNIAVAEKFKAPAPVAAAVGGTAPASSKPKIGSFNF
jgi:hypothetical protein